jgi:hypothetical protein
VADLEFENSKEGILVDLVQPFKGMFNSYWEKSTRAGEVLDLLQLNCSRFQLHCGAWDNRLVLVMAEQGVFLLDAKHEIRASIPYLNQQRMSGCDSAFYGVSDQLGYIVVWCNSAASQVTIATVIVEPELPRLTLVPVENEEGLSQFEMRRLFGDSALFLLIVPTVSEDERIRTLFLCTFPQF